MKRLSVLAAVLAAGVALGQGGGGGLVVPPGGLSSQGVTDIVGGILPTSTVLYAAQAGALLLADGAVGSFTVDSTNLTLYVVTNTASVYVSQVSSTNPALYNGPAVGETWTTPTWDVNEWRWTGAGIGVESWRGSETDGVFASLDFYVYMSSGLGWTGVVGVPLSMAPNFETSLGSFSLDWHTATNTFTIPIASLVGLTINSKSATVLNNIASLTLTAADLGSVPTNDPHYLGALTNAGAFQAAFTNGTTGWADGVLNGSNGVYFSKLGTNYWITVP